MEIYHSLQKHIGSILLLRLSNAWTLTFINNVQYVVYKTDFPLGNAEDLPDYIKQNRFLKIMYIDKRTC